MIDQGTSLFIGRQSRSYQLAVVMASDLPKPDQMALVWDVVVELADYRRVLLPAGFISDCHSTPPWSQSVLPAYDNRTNLAAYVHDYLYTHWESFLAVYPELASVDGRAYADAAYQELMERFGHNPFRNWLYYVAVRLLGGWNWRKFRRESM